MSVWARDYLSSIESVEGLFVPWAEPVVRDWENGSSWAWAVSGAHESCWPSVDLSIYLVNCISDVLNGRAISIIAAIAELLNDIT